MTSRCDSWSMWRDVEGRGSTLAVSLLILSCATVHAERMEFLKAEDGRTAPEKETARPSDGARPSLNGRAVQTSETTSFQITPHRWEQLHGLAIQALISEYNSRPGIIMPAGKDGASFRDRCQRYIQEFDTVEEKSKELISVLGRYPEGWRDGPAQDYAFKAVFLVHWENRNTSRLTTTGVYYEVLAYYSSTGGSEHEQISDFTALFLTLAQWCRGPGQTRRDVLISVEQRLARSGNTDAQSELRGTGNSW